ncbi:TY-Chap domain-containing protein [Spirillospora sp. CA-108201]
MPLADDQIRELVRRFATLDMTGWDTAAFDQALAHLNWQPWRYSADEQKWKREFPRLWDREEYDTGLDTGRGCFSRHGADDVRSSISIRVGEGDELFLRLRSALERLLGPPSIMRGPGPLLRWRLPVQLLELERGSGGHTALGIRPTAAVEEDEYRMSNWAEPEDGLGVLGYWQVIGQGADWVPGGYWTDDWTQLEERLAATLQSVVQDFALLDGPGHFTVVVRTGVDRSFVQWTTHSGWTLQIEAGVPDDSGPSWSEAMAELGWQPSDSPDTEGCVIRRFPTLDAQEHTTAARMLVGALQSYGVAFEDLSYQVISPDVDLLGIGLTRYENRI